MSARRAHNFAAIVAAVAVVLALCIPAGATLFNLSDGNSTAVVDTSIGGITGWHVDGIEHVGKGQMSWFYRVGDSGPENPFSSLNLLFENSVGNFAVATYGDPGGQFTVQVTQSLLGGGAGSGASGIAVQLSASALGQVPVDLRFFEYNDLDLTGSAGDDTATISPGTGFSTALQDDATPTNFVEDITGGFITDLRGPSHHTVDNAADLLTMLADGLPTTLDDATSRATSDAAFGYEFDFSLNPNDPPASQFFATASKQVQSQRIGGGGGGVPEPMTATLGVLGLWALGLGLGRGRRRERMITGHRPQRLVG